MSTQLELNNDDQSSDTFSDCLDQLNDNNNNNNNQDISDEFDFSLEKHSKPLRLKPSKIQQKVEEKRFNITNDEEDEDDDDDDDDDDVLIQSNVLSQYLKPTNILSKYQNEAQEEEEEEEDEEEEEEEEEEKEWPTINITQKQKNSCNENENIENEDIKTSDFDPISFNDLCSYLIKEGEDKIDSDEIIIEDYRNISWFSYIKIYIFGGCAIALKSNELNEERDVIFKIAKLKLDLKNIIHQQFMITLWMKLTDDIGECDKTGSHWQQIGFQGNDPSTDIRGVGLFGILQIFYIIDTYYDIISKIYLLSINKHQNFPLIIVSFKITQIIIQLLRSCLIYNEINKNKSVIFTINEIYVALFYQFYLKWKNNARTIIDFDKTYKELENDAFQNWQQLIQQLSQRNIDIIHNEIDFENISTSKCNKATSKKSDNIKRQKQYQQ